MFAMPADTPVTIPVTEPTVPILVGLLLQVPPVVASLKGVVAPAQTLVIPVGAGGPGLTVSVRVAVQPVGSV